uniref:Uncharacterized protein n=1 Tax=Anguilla anguilla TaxID=7936 RepID=A0A0E9T393_ANGAN
MKSIPGTMVNVHRSVGRGKRKLNYLFLI